MSVLQRVGALWLLLAAVLPQAQAAGVELVLVASADSRIAGLKAEDVRRLYLGVPITVGGRAITPLRNNTDSLLQEVFMQQVMFMSTPDYERQIISRIYRQGGGGPPVYTDREALVAVLRADPDAVSYMFRDMAAAIPGIKIIGVLGWLEK